MKPKYVWLVVVALAAFLILVMQVRVGDKDNQIEDLRQDNLALTSERDGLAEYNKDLRFDLGEAANDYERLLDLQDATVDWGSCLEAWGIQLTQDEPGASIQKTRCDTYLSEMKKISEGK